MFLLPGTITSLRHDWTHPAFPAFPGPHVPIVKTQQDEAEEWLRGFAERARLHYFEMLDAATRFLESGGDDVFVQYGQEDARTEISQIGQQELFWKNFSIVTGVTVPDRFLQGWDGVPFSCSC